ncbi:hypothetical protein ACFL6U_29795 [Planctomycetota bacterium]
MCISLTTLQGKCLCPLLQEHLAFEDGLLYPMALVLIDNEATWKTIKTLEEQVDYSGVHH